MAYKFETPVEVRIHFPSPASGDAYVNIVLRDRVSGILLADLEIDGNEFTQLLAARQVIAKADVPTQAQYEKVGQRAENKTVEGWPSEWVRKTGPRIKDSFGYETLPEMEEWAQEYIEREGWETYEWRYHNYGWGLIVRRHVPLTDEERLEYLDIHKW
jgi:hypothetical protein